MLVPANAINKINRSHADCTGKNKTIIILQEIKKLSWIN